MVALLLVSALAAEQVSAGETTGAPCSDAHDFCISGSDRGSVFLQGRSHLAQAALTGREEEADFCCTWSNDMNNACGTCVSLSRPGDWCGKSEQNCKQCGSRATWCGAGGAPGPTPSPVQTSPQPRPQPTPVHGGGGGWQGHNMKMTHYWDCSGQGCDAGTLQPWDKSKYVSPPGYGPQDPADFGGPLYGEVMWLTGAASDALSALMGPDDGCCGGDPNDGGVGGCGKCALVQNPDSAHPDWTAVVMKKNRCPPWSNGCGAGEPHFDIAAPGFDNLQWSTANICGKAPGTGFASQQQSATLGSWYTKCKDTAECAKLCDQLPAAFRKGCRLFASWGWSKGDPGRVSFRAVPCPPAFVSHVGSQFGPTGPSFAQVTSRDSSFPALAAVNGSQGASNFCCTWSNDMNNACGTCVSPSSAGDWCGQSSGNCKQCGNRATWCGAGTPVGPGPAPTPPPAPVPRPRPTPVQGGGWQGSNMKLTHYWDCSGQGCDAGTLQPWDKSKYVSPPGYGPQDPADFGGPLYGEAMWLTGAASDALSALMGPDDGCCGGDPNDGGVGGCGKCALVQNPDSLHPDWTAVVMKKNRCPPHSNGCGAGEPHFDIAAPGFDNLQWSTANICGKARGTGFTSQQQSATLGSWYTQCQNTADCVKLCDQLPSAFRKGCRLFASWGWYKGDPGRVSFRAVPCPPSFVRHVGSQFGANGPSFVQALSAANSTMVMTN